MGWQRGWEGGWICFMHSRGVFFILGFELGRGKRWESWPGKYRIRWVTAMGTGCFTTYMYMIVMNAWFGS